MPLYDFRLRFNFSEPYRIDSDLEELELLALPHGERVRLCSHEIGKPIKEYSCAAVLGGSYASKHQARNAAEKSKKALLCWAIDRHLGIDLGDRKLEGSLTVVTDKGLMQLQKQRGRPLKRDIIGIDVYEHDENLEFIGIDLKVQLNKNPTIFIDAFRREYLNNRKFTTKQMTASVIYTSSFFDVSPISRFITLVTAVEALLKRQERSDEAQDLVKEFKAKTQQSMVCARTKEAMISSLDGLRYESIRQAGSALARNMIPDKSFNGQLSGDFFKSCYNLRSQILHCGKVTDEKVDIRHLVKDMEMFVALLLPTANVEQ